VAEEAASGGGCDAQASTTLQHGVNDHAACSTCAYSAARSDHSTRIHLTMLLRECKTTRLITGHDIARCGRDSSASRAPDCMRVRQAATQTQLLSGPGPHRSKVTTHARSSMCPRRIFTPVPHGIMPQKTRAVGACAHKGLTYQRGGGGLRPYMRAVCLILNSDMLPYLLSYRR
jgi:hypothetical protein